LVKNTKPLTSMVYERLYGEIVNGTITSNDILTEAALVQKMEVSKSPVREALILLCEENVLQAIPRIGYRVIQITPSQMAKLIEARMALDELSYFAPLPREGGRNREPFQRYPRLHVYNYTVSVVPQIQYMAVFLDSAHNAVGLILEPDGKMTAALSGMVGRGED